MTYSLTKDGPTHRSYKSELGYTFKRQRYLVVGGPADGLMLTSADMDLENIIDEYYSFNTATGEKGLSMIWLWKDLVYHAQKSEAWEEAFKRL